MLKRAEAMTLDVRGRDGDDEADADWEKADRERPLRVGIRERRMVEEDVDAVGESGELKLVMSENFRIGEA